MNVRRSSELAFRNALETDDSAVKVLGEPELLAIARELTASDQDPQLRVLVNRVLRKHGDAPYKQEKATQTVLEWAGSAVQSASIRTEDASSTAAVESSTPAPGTRELAIAAAIPLTAASANGAPATRATASPATNASPLPTA